ARAVARLHRQRRAAPRPLRRADGAYRQEVGGVMPNRYRTILIAVDASDDADRVLAAATEFDPKGDERFHVVTVIPPMVDGLGGMTAGMLAANWPVQEMEAA